MSRKIPLVAIVGRTNVGKSTLFNAIAGRRLSIVEDTPGVTRDRHYALIKRFGFPFTLIDTGGLAGEQELKLEDAVREQTRVAIEEADVILAVFDGISGPHPFDEEVVQLLRESGKNVLWVINKCEAEKNKVASSEFYALGMENLICVAAAHKVGISELAEQIKTALGDSIAPLPPLTGERPIRVAVLGRPNVGKSSLINRILGEERLIASDIAGTTRDSIDISLTREGKEYIIVDTAGLRKKARVDDGTVERYSNLRTLKALVQCDVAVLVLDATQGTLEQDTKIAGLIHERGRPFVIVVNKWDAVEKDHTSSKAYQDLVYRTFKFARYAPILFVSAKSGQRCVHVLKKADEVLSTANERIQTSDLNKLLERAFKLRPPPVVRGEPIKLFFATQVETAPPTFVLFVSHPGKINFGYERYLRNTIREEYPFSGSTIKLEFRKKGKKEDGKGSEA